MSKFNSRFNDDVVYIPKQKTYKTAYCPMFECHVRIDTAWTDDRGDWIFMATNNAEFITEHLFRECELTEFAL